MERNFKWYDVIIIMIIVINIIIMITLRIISATSSAILCNFKCTKHCAEKLVLRNHCIVAQFTIQSRLVPN